MTDNEIIKTLQEMADYPHNYEEGQDLQNALDLINRLQAQNKDLAETVHNLTLEKDALFDKAEELKVEVERLQNILICFMDALGKVRKVDDIDEISLIPLMSELNKQYRAELKAEAYKEFAERLKEKSDSRFDYSELVFEISEEDIDNLVKEMVGDEIVTVSKNDDVSENTVFVE